jgi:predicted DsbA family dithiol-disulfide isomerase
MSLPVSIYSDVICPWCYVGKRRFEAGVALAASATPPVVTWWPFELNPAMPAEGIARADYRAAKFGAAKSAALDVQMIETGRQLGIVFDFVKQTHTPSTRLAHRLIWGAGQADRMAAGQVGQSGGGRQNALVNQLFAAYFEQGADIGRRGVLLDLAKTSGLDVGVARKALEDPVSLDAVLALEREGVDAGIQGVPFFILADKYAISGAQPPEMWKDALPKIQAETAGSA